MTYAMTLDNSWEIMNEDEMYDVNGGVSFSSIKVWGVTIAWELRFTNSELKYLIGITGGSYMVAEGMIKIGVAVKFATMASGIFLIAAGVITTFAFLGWGLALGSAIGGITYTRAIF